MKNQANFIKRQEQRTVKIEENNFIGIKEVLEDKNFFKLWLYEENIEDFNELTLFFYLIKYMSNQNTITTYINEWAKKWNTTRQRISRYIKWLANNKLLKYKANIIMVNPKIIYKGNAYKRNEIISMYDTFKGQK